MSAAPRLAQGCLENMQGNWPEEVELPDRRGKTRSSRKEETEIRYKERFIFSEQRTCSCCSRQQFYILDLEFCSQLHGTRSTLIASCFLDNAQI